MIKVWDYTENNLIEKKVDSLILINDKTGKK